MKLLDILVPLLHRKSQWNYYTLYENVKKWGTQGTFPYGPSMPDQITVTSQFWSKIRELHELTLADEHERAVTVWWVDGDICITPETRGDRDSVTSNYSLKVSYIPHGDGKYYTKQVDVDTRVILSRTVTEEEIPEISTLGSLFNLHTHPPHFEEKNGKKERYYHFFSKIDIQSLLSGDTIISGVITDEVYLLFRTDRSPQYLPESVSDHTITPEYLYNDLDLVQYKGSWTTGTLEKINFTNP